MGYFDGLTDASFKTGEDGRMLFYPYGVIGKGYVLTSDEHYQKARRFMKWTYIIALPPAFLIPMLAGWRWSVPLLVVFMIGFSLAVRSVTKDAGSTAEKLTLAESIRNSARSHNLAVLMLLETFSVLFVLAGIFMMTQGEKLIGVLAIALFGFAACSIGYMILTRMRDKIDSAP